MAVGEYIDVVVEFVTKADTTALPASLTMNRATSLNNSSAQAGVMILAPTAIIIREAMLQHKKEGVVIGWQTIDERQITGFHLIRRMQNGEQVFVTDMPIVAQQAGEAEGAIYSFQDKQSPLHQVVGYELVIILRGNGNQRYELGEIFTGGRLYLPMIVK